MSNKPPSGYYRQLLPSHLAHVRIALTSRPMTGVVVIDSGEVLEALSASEDAFAGYYVEGLRSGAMVTIVVPSVDRSSDQRVWAPGELFMRS